MVCMLAGLLMQTAARRSAEAAVSVALVAGEALQEAAVEAVVFDLLLRGYGSAWAMPPAASATLRVEGSSLQVRVRRTDGLVDLVAGDEPLVDALLARVLGEPHRTLAARLAAWRHRGGRFSPTYADVQSAASLSDAAFDCLHPFITLHSGRRQPDAALANALVRSVLPPELAPPPSAIDMPGALGPSTYRIEVGRPDEALPSVRLSVEVTLTGLLEPAVVVRSRGWTHAGGPRREAGGEPSPDDRCRDRLDGWATSYREAVERGDR